MKLHPSRPQPATKHNAPLSFDASPHAAHPVFQLKRILVPLDFSPRAFKAMEYASALARQFTAELVLMHVVEPYPHVPQMDPVDSESLHEAGHQLETAQESLQSTVRSSVLLRTGEPHLEIVAAARELDVDLIILSTHGRTGLAHALLGSVTERVSRLAPCPVLIVREHERDFVGAPRVNSAAQVARV